jgi:hypothetical protein
LAHLNFEKWPIRTGLFACQFGPKFSCLQTIIRCTMIKINMNVMWEDFLLE